jgi:hypothetical protein
MSEKVVRKKWVALNEPEREAWRDRVRDHFRVFCPYRHWVEAISQWCAYEAGRGRSDDVN